MIASGPQPNVDGEPGLTSCRHTIERDVAYRPAKMIIDREAVTVPRLGAVRLRLNRRMLLAAMTTLLWRSATDEQMQKKPASR